ncbi:MAG: Crp/Fnr family transcriptional regulator [Christensenellales bacterium]|jgi:CRP-like cAMP-binding protein
MHKIVGFLSGTRLFAGIEKDELFSILKCLTHKMVKYLKGETIIAEGDKISSIGMIMNGSAHLTLDDFWGNRSIIAKISAGELFGEVYAYRADKPVNISVTAAENSEIIYFYFNKVVNVCKSACKFHNRLINNLFNIVSEKNLMLTRKMQCITKRTTREKLLAYLSNEYARQGKSRFVIPFNRQELADYLSVDRSAMSNELSKLRKEGIISYNKNEFQLLDSR